MHQKSNQPKKKKSVKLGIAIILLSLIPIVLWHHLGNNLLSSDKEKKTKTSQSKESPLQRPLAFVENQGQWDERAKFAARNGAMTAWFERNAITVQLKEQADSTKIHRTAVRMAFENASSSVTPEGKHRQSGSRNYFIGNDKRKWQQQVPSFQEIFYEGLYSGVDLRLREHVREEAELELEMRCRR